MNSLLVNFLVEFKYQNICRFHYKSLYTLPIAPILREYISVNFSGCLSIEYSLPERNLKKSIELMQRKPVTHGVKYLQIY